MKLLHECNIPRLLYVAWKDKFAVCLGKVDKYIVAGNKPKNNFTAFIVESAAREKRSITIAANGCAGLLARDSPGRV